MSLGAIGDLDRFVALVVKACLYDGLLDDRWCLPTDVIIVVLDSVPVHARQ